MNIKDNTINITGIKEKHKKIIQQCIIVFILVIFGLIDIQLIHDWPKHHSIIPRLYAACTDIQQQHLKNINTIQRDQCIQSGIIYKYPTQTDKLNKLLHANHTNGPITMQDIKKYCAPLNSQPNIMKSCIISLNNINDPEVMRLKPPTSNITQKEK